MKHGHIDTLSSTDARPGVARRVFSGEGATLAFTTMDPGHEAMPHSHPHEQIEFLLEGTMRLVVGDEEVVLEQGGLLVVPPNVEHHGVVVGDTPILALSVFSPKRDEYAAEEAPPQA